MHRLLLKIRNIHLVYACWCFGDGLVGRKNTRHEVSLNDSIFCILVRLDKTSGMKKRQRDCFINSYSSALDCHSHGFYFQTVLNYKFYHAKINKAEKITMSNRLSFSVTRKKITETLRLQLMHEIDFSIKIQMLNLYHASLSSYYDRNFI